MNDLLEKMRKAVNEVEQLIINRDTELWNIIKELADKEESSPLPDELPTDSVLHINNEYYKLITDNYKLSIPDWIISNPNVPKGMIYLLKKELPYSYVWKGFD